MKRCCTCHVVLPLADFYRRSAAKDGRQNRCKSCFRQKYLDDRRHLLAKVHASDVPLRDQKRELLAAYLTEHPCVNCGVSDVRVLDFDHRDPTAKHKGIAQMFTGGWTWQAILAEIDKCDVRCANCHRIRTATVQNWWKHRLQLGRQIAMAAAVEDRLACLLPGSEPTSAAEP